MRTRFEEFLKEDFPNVLSTVGMTGKGESISGYPVSNFATAVGYSVGGRDTIDGAEISASTPGDATSPGFSLYKNKRRKISRRDKLARLKQQIGATVDTLYRPIKKVSEGKHHKDDMTIVIEVQDMIDLIRTKGQIEKIPVKHEYNVGMDTLQTFPNWLVADLSDNGEIYINYWSSDGDYEYNKVKVDEWIRSERAHVVLQYTSDGIAEIIKKMKEYFDIPEAPSYRPRKMVREGSETTPYPGSGTNVGFGEQPLSFVKSVGQAVYGGDSESAMAGNSNSSIGNINKEELTSTPGPKPNFKAFKRRKRKLNKNAKPYNQIGKTIDGLYRGQRKLSEGGGWGNEEQHDKSMSKLILKFKKRNKKVNNKDMKTFEEFTKLYEDGEGAGSAGGGGSATATLGNTGGMGAVVAAQPSSTPGDVAGSTKGSGDISRGLGVYTKDPAGQTQRKKLKKNKNKKDKPYHKIGAGIDNFYRTEYVQSGSNKNVIQSWKAFTDVKI